MSNIIVPEEAKEQVDQAKIISPEELNTKVNVIFAVLCDPTTKEMQLVVNSHNEFVLATALRRMDRAIDGHLYLIEEKRKAKAVQAVPANVLGMLNGDL